MKIMRILLPLILMAETLMAGPPPVKVLVAEITEQNSAEQVAMQGVLYFDKVSGVSTEVDGLVRNINFSKGDTVKAGDVLVKLNTDFIEKDIEFKKTEIQCVDIRIEHTKKDLNRYEKLFSQDAASETEYENLFYSYRDLIKKRESLQVSLNKIKLKKIKSIIRAPFDGIILEKGVDLGAWISHGTVFCKIGSNRDLFVNVPINEKLLRFVEKGSPMDIIINAYDKKVQGRVEGILPMADEKTKSVSLKVRLPIMQNTAVENMSATAYIPTSEKKKVKLVPRDALVKMDGKDFIYTIIDHKAKILPLDVLFFKKDYAYSDSSELFPGMVVIVHGNQRLMENQAVSILGDHL